MSGYQWRGKRPEVPLCECGCGEPAPVARKTDRRYGAVKGQPRRFANGHNSSASPRKAAPPAPGAPACACGCGQAVSLVTKTDRAKGVVRGEFRRYVYGHGGGRRRSEPLAAEPRGGQS